ncbi:MAG: VCBS repeat-containing protein [Planctomycetes bacterium]|nr:VCBS repeat-containing protein [Planctomycetota bacterium]
MDILSGSYSRDEGEMAGLFQVLWGVEGGGFRAPAALNGSDGQPLIIQDRDDLPRICTRPTAVDLDGDGKLDIVSGNFGGTFAVFLGEGEGRISPTHRFLMDEDGSPLAVEGHSDPFFVDWDADGDLDLVSGSASGGALLFLNRGSKKEPKFGPSTTLLPAVESSPDDVFGDDWVHGPQEDTRVWVDDVNGDGKLDVLIGDCVTLTWVAAGLEEAEAKKKLDEWSERMRKAQDEFQAAKGNPTDEQQEKYNEECQKLWKEREGIVRQDSTGFVWVIYRK